MFWGFTHTQVIPSHKKAVQVHTGHGWSQGHWFAANTSGSRRGSSLSGWWVLHGFTILPSNFLIPFSDSKKQFTKLCVCTLRQLVSSQLWFPQVIHLLANHQPPTSWSVEDPEVFMSLLWHDDDFHKTLGGPKSIIICVSTYLSIYLSIHSSIHLYIYQSACFDWFYYYRMG